MTNFRRSAFAERDAFNNTHQYLKECFSAPYDFKAENYESLEWVRDEVVFDKIFKKCQGVQGVLDLGCGPALFGSYLERNETNLHYIGIDCSKRMVEAAKRRLSNNRNVIYLHNFLDDDFVMECENYLFLFKNVLHLISSLSSCFFSLSRKFGSPKKIYIIETVSPDVSILGNVQRIYSIMGVQYKSHWFVQGQIGRMLESFGFNNVDVEIYDQYIDLSKWLSTFKLTDRARGQVVDYINTMPDEIKRNVLKVSNKRIEMLRRQELISFIG